MKTYYEAQKQAMDKYLAKSDAIAQVNKGRIGSLTASRSLDHDYLVSLRAQILDWLKAVDEALAR